MNVFIKLGITGISITIIMFFIIAIIFVKSLLSNDENPINIVQPPKQIIEKDVSPWKCVGNDFIPISKNTSGDVQCLSTDGLNCAWQKDKQSCQKIADNPPAVIIPLSCGKMYYSLYGTDGYSLPTHWCALNKN